MTTPRPPRPTAVRQAAWYVAAWSPFVPLFALLIALSEPRLGAIDAIDAGVRSIAWAAFLGLGAVVVARRVPWPGAVTARVATIHLLAMCAYSAGWLAGILAPIVAADPVNGLAQMRTVIGWQLLQGATTYAVLAIVLYVRRGIVVAREREARLAAAEALRTRAELEALRGRLDPHFLFNTLHSVRALVARDPARAQEAIDRLAALLRTTLDGKRADDDTVTVREELAFVDDYLALEAMRLGDRLRVVREVDAGALDAELPAFTIQPLVENAIVHAIAPRAAGGTLQLRVAGGDAHVTVTVADDGPGADAARVATATGVGLDAVRRRLVASGGARRLELETAPGAGFVARVVLPEPA